MPLFPYLSHFFRKLLFISLGYFSIIDIHIIGEELIKLPLSFRYLTLDKLLIDFFLLLLPFEVNFLAVVVIYGFSVFHTV